MTGMSDFANTSLSPIQIDFLNKLAVSNNIEKVYLNFPYLSPLKDWRKTNILIASISNAYQFLMAKFKVNKNYKDSCLNLFKKYEEVFILSGSCGLEIFNSLKI